jgi:predicted amidohydrolase
MTFTAACVQLRSTTNVTENIETVEKMVREAARAGAHYVQTPESQHRRPEPARRSQLVIQPEGSDPPSSGLQTSPPSSGLFSLSTRCGQAEDGRIANRALLFGADGKLLARYDKIHLFDVDLPNGESWRESAVYRPGDRAVVAELPWLRLGVSICYDIRFPHLYRAQAHAGAAALTAPAAFTRQTGEAHWNVLQRARAIENGAFVISAAQAGRHADGRETFGHSIIVSPWGDVLAEGGGEGPELVIPRSTWRNPSRRGSYPALLNGRPFASQCSARAPLPSVRVMITTRFPADGA